MITIKIEIDKVGTVDVSSLVLEGENVLTCLGRIWPEVERQVEERVREYEESDAQRTFLRPIR